MYSSNSTANNARDIKSTANDMKNTAQDAKSNVKQAFEEVSADAEHIANRVGSEMRSFFSNARDEVYDAKKRVSRQINDNPMQSTAIALLAGFIVGALFRR